MTLYITIGCVEDDSLQHTTIINNPEEFRAMLLDGSFSKEFISFVDDILGALLTKGPLT